MSQALAEDQISRLMGYRSYGHPMMALTATKPGPVRHIITQMVVAGAMMVTPPLQVRVFDPRHHQDPDH